MTHWKHWSMAVLCLTLAVGGLSLATPPAKPKPVVKAMHAVDGLRHHRDWMRSRIRYARKLRDAVGDWADAMDAEVRALEQLSEVMHEWPR